MLLNEQLLIIKTIHPSDLHPCKPTAISSIAESFDKNNFLLAIHAEPDESQYRHDFSGDGYDKDSWIVKANFLSSHNSFDL